MIVLETVSAVQEEIKKQKAAGKSVGFVPTMGALHQGHLSLIEASNQACDYTVSSIFVNPTQFNQKEDFDKYPRTLEQDLQQLEPAGCHLVFAPSFEEMYPEKDEREFDFGSVAEVMEGAHRPGHFNGVAQIVSKLFDAVLPHKAFFGQKDFQQYVIIKALVCQLNYDVEIVACPIVREDSGLAMSSRNQRLTETQLEQASQISKILFWAQDNFKSFSVEELKTEVIYRLKNSEGLELEYFEISETEGLQPVNSWEDNGQIVACVAVFCGKVRLIDNIVFNL
jgi:pantoate--beta-alanine ligase